VLPEAKPCEGARVLARVGDDVILASEVMPAYERELAKRGQIRSSLQKKALLSALLEDRVTTKLIYQDAKRTIPEERLPDIERQIAKHFEKKELPERIEEAGVGSRRELDAKLRASGSSLERAKRTFIEHGLASQWLWQQIDREPRISHREMLDYYREHVADFETPARARWERLTARKPRYGDARGARLKLAQMGNQVMQGMSVADVLRAQPQDGVECEGGVQGWVTQGTLEVSKKLEEAIFNLPVGRLSQIFEEGNRLHIIRVLEREDAKRTPFESPEAQAEIREKLQKLRREEQLQDYLARLKQEIPVETVLDDDPELAALRRQQDAARK
jgi:hypothetical protein